MQDETQPLVLDLSSKGALGTTSMPQDSETRKVVTLCGNSLLNPLDDRSLQRNCIVRKIKASNVLDALEYTKSANPMDRVDCFIFQLITNEARNTKNPGDLVHRCTTDILELVAVCHKKWPNLHIIVSLAPPRADDQTSALIQSSVNNNLKLSLGPHKNVLLIDNEDFGFNGNPDHHLYREDLIHPNQRGSEILLNKYKRALQDIFGFDRW